MASVDYVVARSASQDLRLKDISVTFAGKEAEEVVRAVSLLKKDDTAGALPFPLRFWKLEFYHGARCLDVVYFGGDLAVNTANIAIILALCERLIR